MHNFTELLTGCVNSSLDSIERSNKKILEEMEESASRVMVRGLQALNLHKVILAVGMFSIFDAHLQDRLGSKNGFGEAKKILDQENKHDLGQLFVDLVLAINVLKHGEGRSYDTLIERENELPFKIKLPTESFFNEGDVSEVLTLIEVDDKFVKQCCKCIEEISDVIGENY